MDNTNTIEIDRILRERAVRCENFLLEHLEKFVKPVNEAKSLCSELKKILPALKRANNAALLDGFYAQLKEKNANYSGGSTNECEEETKSTKGRSKRIASKQALSNKTVDCANEKYNGVKQERKSMQSDNEQEKENINIKSEPVTDTDMPPPTVSTVIKKKAKVKVEPNRRPRTRARKMAQCNTDSNDEGKDEETRDSVLIVECNNISIIEITDEEDKPKTPKPAAGVQTKPKSCRSTRTIKKKEYTDENCKRIRSSSEDSTADEQKRTKNGKKAKGQKNNEQKSTCDSVDGNVSSQYEEKNYHNNVTKEMVRQNNLLHDQTVTISTGNNNIHNKTTTVTKSVFDVSEKPILQKQQNSSFHLNDIMTDDESVDEKSMTDKDKTFVRSKQVFSPYDQSPVKKKVEAFEKLGASADTPQTRTRMQAQNKAEDMNSSKMPTKQFSSVPFNRFLPPSQSTIKKNNLLSSSNSNVLKTASASKATQAEYRERELLRKRKEAEALRKKEALLLAAEEKRRKREEKQLKAQQIRETLEKDKQKYLENVERAKELKFKQAIAEKEEKLLKQKQEAEHKRILAKKKANEEKHKKEETKRVHGQQKREDHNKKVESKPIYMIQKAPLLPSTDCYDSDEEDTTSDSRKCLPDWEIKTSLTLTGCRTLIAGNQLKNTLFSVTPSTLDLHEIFPSIESHKLTRSSSAMWTKPPRYTSFMSPLNEQDREESD